MPNSNEFARFIDELRDSRNISREDFVKNIISLRQYYRFIGGESSLKNESINALMEKLEINSIKAYSTFLAKSNENQTLFYKIYQSIILMNYSEAKVNLDLVKYNSVETNQNRKIYKFLEYSLNYYLKLTSMEESVSAIIRLIDYPFILEKNVLTFYELSALFFITDYLIKEKSDYRIAEYTYETLLDKEKHYLAQSSNSLTSFYATAARNLGKIGEFEKSLQMAKMGIKASEKSGTNTTLLNLHYYEALGEKSLSLTTDMFKTLTKMFSLLRVIDNPNIEKEYKKILLKSFDTKESDLVIYKDKKKYKPNASIF